MLSLFAYHQFNYYYTPDPNLLEPVEDLTKLLALRADRYSAADSVPVPVQVQVRVQLFPLSSSINTYHRFRLLSHPFNYKYD